MVSLCGRGFESHQLHYELKDVYFILKHASFNCFLILISEFYLQKVESEMLKKWVSGFSWLVAMDNYE